jgi:hypothetical protein
MNKTILFAAVLLVSSLASFHTHCKIQLTGPSNARIEIKPIGYSEDGNVLCLTLYSVNESGTHELTDTDFGFLIVNKNGTWIEIPYRTIHHDEGFDSLTQFSERFFRYIDFRNPPNWIDSIARKYSIEYSVFENGKNKFFWTKNGIYDGNENLLKSKSEQKTLRNLSNTEGKGTRCPTIIAVKDVLFFENTKTFDDVNADDLILTGALFLTDNFTWEIELYKVTGICFLP